MIADIARNRKGKSLPQIRGSKIKWNADHLYNHPF